MRRPGRRTRPIVNALLNLFRVLFPLLLIACAAFWFVNHTTSSVGLLRVTSSVQGADIVIGGMQTGYTSDTTLTAVTVGKKIVTVRKAGYVSDPEVHIVEVRKGVLSTAAFSMRKLQEVIRVDSIPPSRPAQQDYLSTGLPYRTVPPVSVRPSLLDFSSSTSSGNNRPLTQDEADVVGSEGNGRTFGLSAGTRMPSLNGTEVTVSSVPPGAGINVNGAATPHMTPYTFHGLDRGVYVFAATLSGFVSKPDSAVVTLLRNDQTELLAFELQPDRSKPQPTISIVTSPLAASFRVDGKTAGVGKAEIETSYGNHIIEFAEVPGYSVPEQQIVTILPDAPKAEVIGEYVRLKGNAYLAIMPGDEPRDFDLRLLRVFVDNELVLDRAQQKFDAGLINNVLAGKRSVRVEYGELFDDLHITLIDGEVSEINFMVESFFSKRKLRLKEKPALEVEKWQQKNRKLAVLSLG